MAMAIVDALLIPNAVNDKDGVFPLLLAAQNGHADCGGAVDGDADIPNWGCPPWIRLSRRNRRMSLRYLPAHST